MSTPRDGQAPDGPEDPDRPGWQEPTHLGGGADPGSAGSTGSRGSGSSSGGSGDSGSSAAGWEPPGWSLPPAEPPRADLPPSPPPPPPSSNLPPSDPAPDWDATPPPGDDRRPELWGPPQPPVQADPPPARPGLLARLFGGGRGQQQGGQQSEQQGGQQGTAGRRPAPAPRDPWMRERPPVRPMADLQPLTDWAAQHGWSVTDGTGPEDLAVVQLTATAPVRPGKEDRPAPVVRGRAEGLDLVAFDIVSPAGRAWVPTHGVTAAPVLLSLPVLRLSPARLWRHGAGGMLQIPSGDPEFDLRWALLTAEDGPRVRALAEDPVVRQLLLGTDDGDEVWAAAGFLAAVRPDSHRPSLLEHHARILAAAVTALSRVP